MMVRRQLVARDITDPCVLDALARVPREEFIPEEIRADAYADRALPLSDGQTISQPYIVALMSQALQATAGSRVLEVGTGSGYQAAVLARLGLQVYSIERHLNLHQKARETLDRLGHDRVQLQHGDGRMGWPSAAPFAGILVAAVGDVPPPDLLNQLEEGGRLVMPLRQASGEEVLVVIWQRDGEFLETPLLPVRFVPLQEGIG
jgi:protein-L-isoaspartate(D-aspartate) O-methyltransferase